VHAALQQDHWKEHARQWGLIGPPLRPSHEDLAELESQLRPVLANHPSDGIVLLLGVTPELSHLVLEVLQLRLIAADRSLPMIRSIWASSSPHSAVVQADWRHLPIASNTAVAVIGDGCFTTIGFPEDYRQVLNAISLALKPGGIFTMRFFASPVIAEKPDKVFADLYAGAIENFHIFKWRLAMALLDRNTWSIPVHCIWQSWRETVAAPDDLARHLGWPLSVVNTIDAYRDAPAVYSFPTLPVLLEILSERFNVVASFTPAYELGNRCPTIILRKKE
jgi:SAM-dependent methyltransferase